MFLIVLNVEKAIDGLPNSTIQAALDHCRMAGRMHAYLDALLSNR